MSLGLFARQDLIGLDVPEWITIYVTRDTQRLRNGILTELVMTAAMVGVKGATVIFSNETLAASLIRPPGSSGPSAPHSLREAVKAVRPYFKVVTCDRIYFDEAVAGGTEGGKLPPVAAGRGIILRSSSAQPIVEDIPEAIVGDWCLVIDERTTMVGKSRNPAQMMFEALTSDISEDCFEQGQWSELMDATRLRHATFLLGANMLCKPSKFQNDTFFFAANVLDVMTAKAFNERGLRARWQKDA